MRPRPSLVLMVVIGLVTAACGAGTSTGGSATPSSASTGPPTLAPSAVPTEEPDVAPPDDPVTTASNSCTRLADLPGGGVQPAPATGEPFPWDREDVDVADGLTLDEIIPGGPPPDGILPIDDPCFDTVDVADAWLEDDSPLMVLAFDGTVRAYPLAILTQHEIVNDVVDGTPVLVTYCPLCNSALAFHRTVHGVVHDFGTSGRLWLSNLVMYDRQTRSLWTQFLGHAIVGDLLGTSLDRIPTSLLGWADVRALHPEALVLSPATFPAREYGRNPYPGLEDGGSFFRDPSTEDDRLPPTTRVVGLGADRDPVALVLEDLRAAGVTEARVDGRLVTVWWAPGQASAIDAPTVDEGRDVGSTVAFEAELDDGTELAFEPDPDDDRFVETTTGTTFDLAGTALEGPLAGTELVPVARDDTFWFVWFAFQPTTRVA